MHQKQRAIRGLVVPGMSLGSPGMEGPNPQRYGIVVFDGAGNTRVFATRHGQSH